MMGLLVGGMENAGGSLGAQDVLDAGLVGDIATQARTSMREAARNSRSISKGCSPPAQ